MTGLHTDAHRRLVRLLKDAREQAKLSQYELADRLGVDQSYVSKYERARQRLDVIEFLRIVRAIGCDHDAIIEEVLRSGDFDPPQ